MEGNGQDPEALLRLGDVVVHNINVKGYLVDAIGKTCLIRCLPVVAALDPKRERVDSVGPDSGKHFAILREQVQSGGCGLYRGVLKKLVLVNVSVVAKKGHRTIAHQYAEDVVDGADSNGKLRRNDLRKRKRVGVEYRNTSRAGLYHR